MTDVELITEFQTLNHSKLNKETIKIFCPDSSVKPFFYDALSAKSFDKCIFYIDDLTAREINRQHHTIKEGLCIASGSDVLVCQLVLKYQRPGHYLILATPFQKAA